MVNSGIPTLPVGRPSNADVEAHDGRVLLSYDAGWYHVGAPGGGEFRAYTTLVDDFLPALRAAGFTDAEVRRLTVGNPREVLMSRVRRLGGGPSRSPRSSEAQRPRCYLPLESLEFCSGERWAIECP
jgi:hypothetical protein